MRGSSEKLGWGSKQGTINKGPKNLEKTLKFILRALRNDLKIVDWGYYMIR